MRSGAVSVDALKEVAARARRWVVRLGHDAGSFGAHFGPALSLVEVMTALYSVAAWDPERRADMGRNRVILSKGHGSLALYAVLHEFGYFDEEVLRTAEKDGSALPGQPVKNRELGVEFSSGSLGMGLGYGVGLALSARLMGSDRSTYVVLGDGETNEGSVWEAAMAAAHFGLTRLTAVVDLNSLQSDGRTSEIMSVKPRLQWGAFGWEVTEVDGHSIADLRAALSGWSTSAPRCVLAHTTKGKGVSFMESVAEWHHGRMTVSEFETASRETGLIEETQPLAERDGPPVA
jgi:transketolase